MDGTSGERHLLVCNHTGTEVRHTGTAPLLYRVHPAHIGWAIIHVHIHVHGPHPIRVSHR